MNNETTNVDYGCSTKMLAFNPEEKGLQVAKANKIGRTRAYLEQNGTLSIQAFNNTPKDRAKLAAKRAAEKAVDTRREDSGRSY